MNFAWTGGLVNHAVWRHTIQTLTPVAFDREQLKEAVNGKEVEHTLLPGGRNSFEHQRLTAASTTLDSGAHSRAVLARLGVPRGL